MREVAPARAALSVPVAILLPLALLAAGTAPANAQAGGSSATDPGAEPPPPFSLAARMGFAHAKGDLGDFVDDGYVVGLAVGRRVSRRVTLVVEGTVEDYERGGRLTPGPPLTGVLGPNIELWRVMGLASVELTDPAPGASRWEVAVQTGAGATVVSADAFANAPAFETVEPTLMAGVRTGYELGRHVLAFVRGGGSIWFGDPESGGSYFRKEVTFTHSAGLRFRF